MGAAIATVIAFLPLVGFQTMIAIGIAAIFRANKAICIPIVWVTNPFTMGPIYGGCFALGRALLPADDIGQKEALPRLIELAKSGSILDMQFWADFFHVLVSIGAELWFGCAIVGVVLGLAAYFMMRMGVISYRERRRQRMLKRSLFRSKLQQNKVIRQTESL